MKVSEEGAHFGDSYDVEKQQYAEDNPSHDLSVDDSATQQQSTVVSDGDQSLHLQNAAANLPLVTDFSNVESPKKPHLSRDPSSHDQCRVCQEEKEEDLIDLGCHCRGGLAKAHPSCISTWFCSRGSNKCEICQQVAVNVALPESQASASYWVWRVDSSYRGTGIAQEPQRGCFSPLWVAFSILAGGLLLDVLISITLGVSALPVNIIIGVIIVLGLGTALRLALEFCHEWSVRRVVQRVEANASIGYHPAL